jgi:hypothetical protein
MRPIALAAALAAVLPSLPLLAADVTPAPAPTPAAAATAAVPAVNAAFARRMLESATVVSQTCQSNLDVAKAAASVPFAGDKARKKVDQAQASVDVANGIRTDLTAVSQGRAPATDGVLAQIAASQAAAKPGAPAPASPLDRIKSIPGAQAVIDVLSTPGVAAALVQSLPLDKVPGYSTAVQALGLAAP